jgi:site-specific recombinase XerD
MAKTPATVSASDLPTELGTLIERAASYANRARAKNTARAYEADWRDFRTWCADHSLESLPALPTTVGVYLADLAQRAKVATLSRRLIAITAAHRSARQELDTRHPAIRDTMKGIRRAHGAAQVGKTPTLVADIKEMVKDLGEGPKALRDRALLLLGFAGAFRRSELVDLNVADLDLGPDGLAVTLRRSKTDQEGQGRPVGIPYGSNPCTCPVRALKAWLEAAGIISGPVFRRVSKAGLVADARLTDRAVALVVKACAAAAGLDPDKYAGHSLRAGLATSAAAAGASERSIMAQTGHRSVTMVRRYIRSGELFRENAAAKVGL